MAGKKYSDIYAVSNTTIVANSDLFILQRADGNTYALTANTLYLNISDIITGPFANDISAAAANVAVQQMYYSSDGTVKIRLS